MAARFHAPRLPGDTVAVGTPSSSWWRNCPRPPPAGEPATGSSPTAYMSRRGPGGPPTARGRRWAFPPPTSARLSDAHDARAVVERTYAPSATWSPARLVRHLPRAHDALVLPDDDPPRRSSAPEAPPKITGAGGNQPKCTRGETAPS